MLLWLHYYSVQSLGQHYVQLSLYFHTHPPAHALIMCQRLRKQQVLPAAGSHAAIILGADKTNLWGDTMHELSSVVV